VVAKGSWWRREKGGFMNLDLILVAVDFSEVSASVYDVAVELASRMHAEVVVVNVTEPQVDYVGLAAPLEYAVRDSELDKILEARLSSAREAFEIRGVTVKVEHHWGPVVGSILERAQKLQAGMVVLGSHGHGAVYNLLVGSVAAGVIKHSPLPVLVVPDVRAPKTVVPAVPEVNVVEE